MSKAKKSAAKRTTGQSKKTGLKSKQEDRPMVWKQVMPKQKHAKRPPLAKGLPIAKRVFRDLMREKTIVFAVFLQLFIIMTSTILLTNSESLFNPDSMMQDPLVVAITGDELLSRQMETYLAGDRITPVIYPEHSDALEKFDEGVIDGIVSMNRSEENFPIFVDLIVSKGDVTSSMLISHIKDAMELYENQVRDRYLAEPNAIRLDKLKIRASGNSIMTQIFEALYSILLPFLLLMPGVLLGGLVIDIIIEELETKTLNLLMLVISFKRYLFEILLATVSLSMLQVLAWEFLLLGQGIAIANLPAITGLIFLLNLILFIMCIILTLGVMDKTRAQLIYSFLVILLFASAPLFSVNPIRVITRLALGLVSVPLMAYMLALSGIAAVLFISMMVVVSAKQW